MAPSLFKLNRHPGFYFLCGFFSVWGCCSAHRQKTSKNQRSFSSCTLFKTNWSLHQRDRKAMYTCLYTVLAAFFLQMHPFFKHITDFSHSYVHDTCFVATDMIPTHIWECAFHFKMICNSRSSTLLCTFYWFEPQRSHLSMNYPVQAVAIS